MLVKKKQLNPTQIQKKCVILYLHVGDEPTRLTTSSIWVSRVLGGQGQKLTRTQICKNSSTQLDLNPWWVGLAYGF